MYLLEAAATCGLCGAKIHIQSQTGGGYPAQYVCARRKVPIDTPCTAPRVMTAALDERIWSELTALLACDRFAEHLARRLRDGAPATDAAAQATRARAELARLDRAEALLLDRVDRITPAALDRQLASLATARVAARDLLRAADKALYQAPVGITQDDTPAMEIEVIMPGEDAEDDGAGGFTHGILGQ